MVGLDGTGKTIILYRLKLEETIISISTIDFNAETINYKNISFTIWDVGGVPLLNFANKQDIPNVMNTTEITEKLGLHSLNNRNWYIQTTCATSGDGLH
ncbi:unnamed protein product [Adineta steineri]|uniref:Uncharacterized protein n=1 Tax=Adineta steineri TaxID=433720 RepID=A0A814LXT1_9BILA|nr:unnamed protein product [Adineta steineri]CAF1204741.1 unnamed protein product [Adineta steineri]CAF1271859.1 unnamed protein product [Adineta steineri]